MWFVLFEGLFRRGQDWGIGSAHVRGGSKIISLSICEKTVLASVSCHMFTPPHTHTTPPPHTHTHNM